MPDRKTTEAAKQDLREGKSASTAAGEFVREEMHHIREGKHGAASTKQAIAIGLSKARRAGVPLKPQGKGKASDAQVKAEEEAYEVGQGTRKPKAPSAKRSRAMRARLKRAGHGAASHAALSRQAKGSARRRTAAQRSASARKAARTRAG